MNNDNEIMKEFNETFGPQPEPQVEPYRVVQNQNIMDSSKVNNTINQNIQNNSNNIAMPNFVTQNPAPINMVPEVNNTVINSNPAMEDINSINNQPIQQQLYNTTNYINDSDRPVEPKQKKATIKINPELKTVMLLALVLLIAMAFIPTIFDWLDALKIKIFG